MEYGIMESWNHGIMESHNHGTELNRFDYRLYTHRPPPVFDDSTIRQNQ